MAHNTSTSRRHFLASQSFGLTALALAWLLKAEGVRAEPAKPNLDKPQFDLLPKMPPRPAQATAMISMFMQGGPSHIDLFDPNRWRNKVASSWMRTGPR